MSIDYSHSLNLHTQEGPRAALPLILGGDLPVSLLDVGCGTGTWIRAAREAGVVYCFGVDGVDIPPDSLLFPETDFVRQDLTQPWDLRRRFDVVLCLEVAEHLDGDHAAVLIDSLTKHGDKVVFSAACPGQGGQHHVNCQWPAYWQRMFNDAGYACDDSARWTIWSENRIEPWYRQNIFTAERNNALAGSEPRIQPVIHPEMLGGIKKHGSELTLGQTLQLLRAHLGLRTRIKRLIDRTKS